MERILIITNSSGGLYLFRRELINELISMGYSISIVTPSGEHFDDFLAMGCLMYRVEIERRGTNPLKELLLLARYKSVLEIIKPNMVITYTIKPNLYGGWLCRRKKIPYSANITGLGTAFQKKGILNNAVVLMYKQALRCAKVVFFENNSNLDTFIRLKIIKTQQACLLNGAGVNLEYFKYSEYPRDEDSVRFLFVGRVMKEKGIDELLSAMKRLHQVNSKCILDIIGPLEEDYSKIIESIDKYGYVRYCGYQNDVRPFLVNAHCVVLPSWHEGMANSILEAAAVGRPIITCDIPGCREAVIDSVSGFLCKPKDADSLFYTMQMFSALTFDQKVQMGVAGREHIESLFDKKQVVDKTITMLLK